MDLDLPPTMSSALAQQSSQQEDLGLLGYAQHQDFQDQAHDCAQMIQKRGQLHILAIRWAIEL